MNQFKIVEVQHGEMVFILPTGRDILVVATSLKYQNTFVWDEDQASENNK